MNPDATQRPFLGLHSETQPLTTSLPTSIRGINQLRLLQALRVTPGISRSELASRTGLAKATVSALINEFISNGLICEHEQTDKRAHAGRHPVKLAFDPHTAVVIGIELTGGECVAALCDLHARPVRSATYPMARSTIHQATATIGRAIRDLCNGYEDHAAIAIGIGIPGVVDSSQQVVVLAENIGWNGVPFAQLVERKTGTRALLANRSNAGALGEYSNGAAKGVQNLIYVTINLGIGAGIIINGQLYGGTNGSAGELGHTKIIADGSLCTCGNTGCLETLVSVPAVLRRAKLELRRDALDVNTLLRLLPEGNEHAMRVIDDTATHLGTALANLINLFNPEVVVIDSPLADPDGIFIRSLRRTIKQRAFHVPFSAVRIIPESLGHLGPAVGAANLAAQDALLSGKLSQVGSHG